MSHQEVLNNTLLFVKQTLENAEGGHDWFHIERVYNNAMLIAESEVCDPIVVKLAALLHDIADSKFHNGDESIGPKTAKIFLETQKVDELTLQHILKIIENISFKGGKTQKTFWYLSWIFFKKYTSRIGSRNGFLYAIRKQLYYVGTQTLFYSCP